MKISTLKIFVIVAAAFADVCGTKALAQEGTGFELNGECSWQTSGNQIEISAAEVENNNEAGSVSGTLKLVVWATASPYEGGTIDGYKLGAYILGALPGQEYFPDVYDDVAYTPPANGTYYTTLALEEYTADPASADGYVIVAYVDTGSQTFGPINYYNVVTKASPASGGSATGGGSYRSGASVTLTATANAGYHFVCWTYAGADWSDSAEVSTTVEGNYTFVAVFAPTIVTDQLLLITNGLGKITHNFNGEELIAGRSYTVTAVPGPGQVFVNWTGSIDSTKSTLTFVLEANMTLQANFVPNPFPALKGVYSGLFYRTTNIEVRAPPPSNLIRLVTVPVPDHESSGFATFSLSDTGTYTGKMMTAGQSFAIEGRFGVDGGTQLSIPRASPEPLTFSLQLDLSGATQRVSGSVSNATWSASFLGNRTPFNGSNLKAPQAGRYTLAFAPTDGDSMMPQGTSIAAAIVSQNGTVQFSGTLADGTAISQSVGLSESGACPIYVSLYGGKGSFLSWVTLTNEGSNIVDYSAAAVPACWWIKAGASGSHYIGGFTNSLTLFGSPYHAVVDAPLLNLANAEGQVILSAGNLEDSLTNQFVLTNKNEFDPAPAGDKIALTVTASSGLILGSFVDPATGLTTPIKGVVLQQQTSAAGFFLSSGQSGAMWVTEE